LTLSTYHFALRVAFGKAEIELVLLCAPIVDGYPEVTERFIEQIQETGAEPLDEDSLPCLIAPYFSKEARSLCREAEVGYFDLAGNANIETSAIYFNTSRRVNEHKRKKQVRTPFTGKAERIVRRLLLEQDRHWHMRDLAQAAEVSLGLASMTTSSLAEQGFVSKDHSGLDLFDAGGLLDAWSQRYDLHRNTLRTYQTRGNGSQIVRYLAEHEDDLGGRYALTLWSGADRLLRQNRTASHLALYWTEPADELVQELHLNRDTGKTYVFVFQPYDESLVWEAKRTEHGLYIAHPLQLFLDLASGDEKEVALSQRVRARLLPY